MSTGKIFLPGEFFIATSMLVVAFVQGFVPVVTILGAKTTRNHKGQDEWFNQAVT
jgi:hypothetical protein